MTRLGLSDHLRLGTPVTGATYDAARGTWMVEAGGERLEARVLVAATGGLSRPSYPDLEGLDSFRGRIFHSARWDHTRPLDGARVAVIGTGASAIQIVPGIVDRVSRLHVYQRTAPWILPKADRPIPEGRRRLYARVPVAQQLARLSLYWRHELLAYGFVRNPRILRLASRLAYRHLARQVADPALREALTPQFTMGCKRILLSNDYYPALCREHVEVVTSPIVRVGPEGVETEDGVARPVDAIVLATGFQAAEVGAPFPLRAGDTDLDAAWADGPQAYLGTTVAGFPNLFFIVGPNTGLGHSSMILMIESQARYILEAVRTMRRRGLAAVEVEPEAQAKFNANLARRFPRTVWSSGCVSWYRTRDGRNTTLWPGFTLEYRLRTWRFDAGRYRLTPKDAAAS